MRRMISFFLALALILTLALPVFAADINKFTDISGHWARRSIETVAQRDLMLGTSETTFAPDLVLTRGMFVTVLARFAGINTKAWKMNYDGKLFRDVDESTYYSAAINWAARNGIVLGDGHGTFQPDAPITREQLLTILQRYADVTGQTFQAANILGLDAPDSAFTDVNEISRWARAAVQQLQSCGIVQGISNNDGTYAFAPKMDATRAQAATIFSRMLGIVAPKPNWSENFATLIMLNESILTLKKGESTTLTAQLFPANTTNQTVTWISSNPKVATAEDGVITWVGEGRCTIYAYSSNGCKATCSVTCEKPVTAPTASAPTVDFIPQDTSLAYASESYAQKCDRIFGAYTSDPRAVYGSKEAAQANMVTISVPAWDIASNGEKYTRYFSLTVHRNIAATVDQIFREIYECPARYPIHSMGGFRYEARSEHNCGLAIDINPNENFYCSPSGQALVGSFFKPEANQYSIPVGGEIDQIFKKYGFTRGIYWNSGYKDYMHYSFFGT